MNSFQRATVRAINGSIQIGGRCWRWPWQFTGFWPRTMRFFWLCFGCWAAYRISIFWPWMGAAGIGLLLLLGYWQALPGAAGDDTEPEWEPGPEADILAMVVDLIGTDSGIHLDVLLDRLQQEPGCAEMTRDQLRQILHEVGCPIRRALRVGTRTGVAGVHRDDAQAALDALTEDPTPLPPPTSPPDCRSGRSRRS